MVKDIICVACPMGCQISVELNDDTWNEFVDTCNSAAAFTPLFPSSPQRLFRRTRSRTASRR